MEVRVYVGNLNKATTQDQINTLFATAGTVSSVDLVMDKRTGASKGFAFVSMPTQEDADKAISMFHDYDLADNKLKVNVAKPRAASSRNKIITTLYPCPARDEGNFNNAAHHFIGGKRTSSIGNIASEPSR
jgi:RNA recognition motif-containing protein